MKLPHNTVIENREYQPAEVSELAIRLLHSELAHCINMLERRRNETVIAQDHPMVASGIREAILALRARAKDLGVPAQMENEITTPIDPLPSGRIEIDEEE